MNAMLKKLNNKKSGKKGFTLMEMLIVVAIIAVLVAIAIPTFNNALNKATDGADTANVRAWYAESLIANMVDDKDLPTTYTGTLQADGAEVTVSGTTMETFSITYTSDYNTDGITFPVD